MKASLAASSSRSAPVSTTASRMSVPPYRRATSASSAPFGLILPALTASTATAVKTGTVTSTLPTSRAPAVRITLRLGLAHRRRELAQRLQPGIGEPGAGKAGGQLGPAQAAQAPDVTKHLGKGLGGQLPHHGPEQPGVHRQRGQRQRQGQAGHQPGPAPAEQTDDEDRDQGGDQPPVWPERIHRRQVAHRRDRAERDGEQVGADHQRPGDHPDARAERLDRGGDAATPRPDSDARPRDARARPARRPRW